MTRLHTPVCKLLGIDVPIFQAGMSRYTTAELVAAVSNAGGLGIIGGLGRSPDELRDEIRLVRELTSRPFGVNHVVCQLNPAALEVTLAQRVPVLSLAWGRAADLTYQAHEAGSKVIHMVATPEEAGLVALYVGMHTATRIAVQALPRIKQLFDSYTIHCHELSSLILSS